MFQLVACTMVMPSIRMLLPLVINTPLDEVGTLERLQLGLQSGSLAGAHGGDSPGKNAAARIPRPLIDTLCT
jgi:hypothetical protein